jgi:hypothetical protein
LGAFFGTDLRRARIRQPVSVAKAFESLLIACNAVPVNSETRRILTREAREWGSIPARQMNGRFITTRVSSSTGSSIIVTPQVGTAYRQLCFEQNRMDIKPRNWSW